MRALAATMAGRVSSRSAAFRRARRELDLADFRPPDSALARHAERPAASSRPRSPATATGPTCSEAALAALDGEPLDRELFYVAALLHDLGIEQPVAGEDFTLRSAARAIDCAHAGGLADHQAELIADAITIHASPGITAERDGALGFYVQSGATLDLGGFRQWDIPEAARPGRDPAASPARRSRSASRT